MSVEHIDRSSGPSRSCFGGVRGRPLPVLVAGVSYVNVPSLPRGSLFCLCLAPRAEGVIRAGDAWASIRFVDPHTPSAPGPEFLIALSLRRFCNGGNWSFFCCPRCARRPRRLWLLDGQPSCYWCCEARGVRGRAATLPRSQRAVHRQRRVLALFNGPPARLHPRPGRTMDRREQLDRSLRRSQDGREAASDARRREGARRFAL